MNQHSSRSHSVFMMQAATLTHPSTHMHAHTHSQSLTHMHGATSSPRACSCQVETRQPGSNKVAFGQLNLVDLAGSECIGATGASGNTAAEAKVINKSLLTLARCVSALSTGEKHVPFRESELTRVLQDSLGGNCYSAIILAVSPLRANIEQTLTTLRFGASAKKITNQVRQNTKVSEVDALREEVPHGSR
jgi:hypothetical protein